MLGVHISSYAQVQGGPPDSLSQQMQGSGQGQRGGSSTQGVAPKPEQEGQVNFQSSDSLVFVFDTSRTATLHGSASVSHTAGQLKAGQVNMNIDRNIVSAESSTPKDTLSHPVLIRESDKVRSNRIDFNYQTEKGRFEVARLNIQDGNVIGTKVKKTAPHVVFLEDAKYSTCMLDHPHYYIRADRMKVVDQEKIFFERARLFILDIPYPIVFPFGYLPGKFNRKQSGMLEPTYAFQQKETRGLGLQNLGWFQYFSDYLTGQASFDIFTSGSYFVDSRVQYSNRNRYNGSIQLGYSHDNSGLEPTDPGYQTTIQKQLRISHQQDFSPYADISANINLRTSDYYQQNSYDPDERAETSTSSSINYNYRHPEGTYNFSATINQNQNFLTNRTRLSGPDLDFSLQRFSPFENEATTAEQSRWYENLSISYDNSFQSDFSYQPTDRDSARYNWFQALKDPDIYREATGNNDYIQYGFQQGLDLSLGQLLSSPFLNLTASANYNEYWLPSSTRKYYAPDSTDTVQERRIRGFNTARDFSTSLSFSTTLYGMMNAKIGKLEAFRHTFRPSLSFGYRPDFSSDFWGYYRTVQTDSLREDGTRPEQQYSIFENEVFTGPGSGEQRSLSLSINNTFEAKKVSRDSTGEKQEEVIRLIDQLSMNTNYNFAADSLKLADLNTSMSARIVEGLRIRAGANFNFYERDQDGGKIDKFLLTNSGKPFEMTSFNASTSYSFSWGQDGLQARDRDPYFPATYDPLNQRMFHPVDPHFNSQPVREFNSPFSFDVNLSYRWSRNARSTSGPQTRATINASNINLKLTPKWDFRTQIGYDFVEKELTPSQFSLSRNLHCWDLSFTMNPFGENQYYFFSLRINAGQLQGIIQKLPILNNLERSSTSTGRRPPTGFGGY
jgi:hypothetical protein